MSPYRKSGRRLPASQANLDVLTDAMPQIVWSTLPDGYHDFYNAKWYEFTGVPIGSSDGEGWSGLFHPDDQPRAWERWNRSLATGEPYEVEYRLRHHSGSYRWTLGRALPVRDEEGNITRWIGTCTDIDEAKRAAEHNEILSHELSHRIKNIFAIIGGLITLSVRHAPEARAFADSLRQRIAALGRAHEFVRPHSRASRPVAFSSTVEGLLKELFRPYVAIGQGRITIRGDEVRIDDRGATPFAMLFHELATNAMKYGALSAPAGQIDIEIRLEEGVVTATWTETGGPAITGAPAGLGFGTRLAEVSIQQQLDGSLERHWHPAGLQVVVTVNQANLARE